MLQAGSLDKCVHPPCPLNCCLPLTVTSKAPSNGLQTAAARPRLQGQNPTINCCGTVAPGSVHLQCTTALYDRCCSYLALGVAQATASCCSCWLSSCLSDDGPSPSNSSFCPPRLNIAASFTSERSVILCVYGLDDWCPSKHSGTILHGRCTATLLRRRSNFVST